MSTLDGAHLSALRLEIPLWGSPYADIILEGGALPVVGAKATLTVGTLVLVGAIVQSNDDAPDKPHAVLVVGSGWDGLVTAPISYQSDGGVRLSTILTALSAAAGETIAQPPDVTVGNYYELVASRMGEPVRYRDALNELARAGVIAGWRADGDGVTRFAARAPAAITARATVLSQDAELGLTVVGLDDPATFLPGATLGGVPVARLVVRETSGKLEADVYAAEPAAAPTIRASILRIVASLFGDYARTMMVASVGGDGRLNLVPPPDAPHLPEMGNVEQWTLGGAVVTPIAGTEVLVLFRDERRTRPVVVAFGSGTPTSLVLDALGEILVGARSSSVTIAGGSDSVLAAAATGRVVRWGDIAIFPVGTAGTLTALPLLASAAGGVGAPTSPALVSKVTA